MTTLVRVHYFMVNAGPIRQDMGCLRWPKLGGGVLGLEASPLTAGPAPRKTDCVMIQTSGPVLLEMNCAAGPGRAPDDSSVELPAGSTILSCAEGWMLTFKSLE